jgi:phage-related protein
MATELGKAYVQIIPSAKGIGSSISSELNGESAKAGESAGLNLVGKLKGVIAAAGIGAAIKSSLEAGGDLQQSFGGLDTLYGDAADAAKAYAAEAAKAGISANNYAEQAVSFGASLKQAFEGDTTKAVEAANTAIMDMADNAAKMGTPIESIQNAYQGFAKGNYTMLDNLKLGFGGTKTEMERLLATAEKSPKNVLGKSFDINNLGDVYEAIHIIQEELELTGVAADEAKTTFSGSLGAMKAAGQNLLANLSLGEDIGPSLMVLSQTIHTFLFDNLFPMIGNILQALPQLLSGLGGILIGALNGISNNADQIVAIAIELVTSLADAIVTALPYLVEAAINIVMALGRALIETDWGAVGTELMGNLRDSIDLAAGEILGADSFTIESFLDGITAGLPGVLDKGIEIITNVVNGILSALPQLITAAGQLVTQFAMFLMQNYPTIMQKGAELLLNLVNGIINNLPQIVSAVVQVIASFAATILQNLPTILAQGITIIAKLVAGLIQAIPQVVAAIPQIIQSIVNTFGSYDWLSIGKNIIQGIANGISNAAGIIVDAAKNAAQSAFNAAKDFLGIASPAKKGIYLGEMLDAGFALGIDRNKGMVDDAINNLSESATANLVTAGSFDVNNGPTADDKMDALLAMLGTYLPEIAEKQGIDVQTLYNGINRQLGWAIS